MDPAIEAIRMELKLANYWIEFYGTVLHSLHYRNLAGANSRWLSKLLYSYLLSI
jgi:hypothetical protein